MHNTPGTHGTSGASPHDAPFHSRHGKQKEGNKRDYVRLRRVLRSVAGVQVPFFSYPPGAGESRKNKQNKTINFMILCCGAELSKTVQYG